MSTSSEELAEKLLPIARGFEPACNKIHDLTRLTGGASQEMWSFRLTAAEDGPTCVLRREPPGRAQESSENRLGVSLTDEARLYKRAAQQDVPVPKIRHTCSPEEGLGEGFIMDFVEGETIPQKILKSESLAPVLPKLARQCGEVLPRIHAIPLDDLDMLPRLDAESVWNRYRDLYDQFGHPNPVFEYAFRWLEERLPHEHVMTFVHGDFRHGNLMIGSEGLRAVLDWELAQVSDPMQDLAWLCVPSWRFGRIHNPVGGFGQREELFESYESQRGTSVDIERVRYWEIFGSLRWGLMCRSMYGMFASGQDRSVERAAIARRVSETEIDLLRALLKEN